MKTIIRLTLALLLSSYLLSGTSHAQKSISMLILEDDAHFFPPTGKNKLASTSLLWDNGQTIKISFINGTEWQKNKVKKYAREWTEHANLKFDFLDKGEGVVRIAFKWAGSAESWSYVGKYALRVPVNEPTMIFGWIDENSSEQEIKRTILHEFGHALGCGHEHQSPASRIKWNTSEVYKFYKNIYGWDSTKVYWNVLQTKKSSIFTEFDPQSIMMYPVGPDETADKKMYSINYDLSPTDEKMIGKIYPYGDSIADKFISKFKIEKCVTTATLVNYYQGDITVFIEGQKYFLHPGEKAYPQVKENGSQALLWSCGWDPCETSPGKAAGCRYIQYTISAGETWAVVEIYPAPRIIMKIRN